MYSEKVIENFLCPRNTSCMPTVLAKGKTIDEAMEITEQDIIDALAGLLEREETLFQFGRKCFEKGYSELY